MNKRFISLLLCAIFIAAAVSCSEKTDSTTPSGLTSADESAADTGNTSGFSDYAASYLDFDDPDVPPTTYDDRVFHILYYGSEAPKDEETGEVVDDAKYITRRTVEERLKIDIQYVMVPGIVDLQPALSKAVKAGDSAYDLAINHCIHAIPTIISEKSVHDWNRIEHVDFSRPYWNRSMNDTLSINGILPMANGNFFATQPMCIFFNKQIQADYNIGDFYAAVLEGKWTLEQFCSTAKLISSDLNGDGQYGVEDLYGMIGMSDYQFMGFLAGCNQYVVEKDENDFPTVALNNEKTFDIYTQLHSLIYDTTSARVWAYGSKPSVQIPFDSNQALFWIAGSLGEAVGLRSMETDFGIIPFPKYNETQKDYMSIELGEFLMVPFTASYTALCGTAAELLCAESRRRVLPVYVDKMLVSKATRDNESEDMVYLILDSVVYDFGVNLGYYTDLSYILGFTLRTNTSDFSSYVSSRIDKTNKHYSTVYDYYLEYAEIYG
ncbi:MAG: hypothetical protein ACYCWE_15375 [Eubacteriales bacterium]